MKIAYISSSAYSDVDLSYIGEAQKSLDITYFVLMEELVLWICATIAFYMESTKAIILKGWESIQI